MEEAEGIPPTASTASAGLGIRYVGDWAYATSGVVAIAGSEVSALEGTTGTGIIVGDIQFFSDQTAGDNFNFRIYYNDVAVVQTILSATHDTPPYGYYPISVVIPPFTDIKVALSNTSQGVARNWTILLGGRVYDA